jgi:hypothetical protein
VRLLKKTTMPKIENPFLLALLTVIMTAFGIYMLVVYCPTPAFDPLTLVHAHRLPIGFSLVAGALIGWLLTRDALRSLMLAMGGMFLLFGMFFFINGAMDMSVPEDLFFEVIRKGEEYHDNATRPSAISYYLLGIDRTRGETFKFSTYATHITKADYDAVNLDEGPAWVHLKVRQGRLKVPWRRIQGIVFDPKAANPP